MKGPCLRLVAAFAWLAALFPLVRWWVRRLAEPMDFGLFAALGLVACTTLLWVAAPQRRAAPAAWKLVLAAGGLVVFAVARPFLPLTLAGLPAVLTGLPLFLPEGLRQGRLPLPLYALAALALPSAMVLDMLLGVPLRSVAVCGAEHLLQVLGREVVRRGFELSVDGRPIWVDAPCAGVKMLGAGAWLACMLAQVFRLDVRRTLALGALALVLLVVCNTMRVTVLTLCEVRGYGLSAAAHSGVGLLALVPGVMACAGAAFLLVRGQAPVAWGQVPGPAVSVRHVAAGVALVLACGLCLAVPSQVGQDSSVRHDFPGWPAEFEGRALVAEPLNDGREIAFAEDFPGRIGRFKAGSALVILRWTDRPTHRVHSTGACLAAAGWRLEPRPLLRREDGDWSAFRAVRAGRTLEVREQVRSASGRVFADIPSWFVSGLLGRDTGPWWIATVVGRVGEDDI